ncbi:alpha-N-acetylglucosaminidase [Nonomuraea sp. NPDC049625]|uniref:alpha-N-acetylglucosaminidase n=1 Tax=Nonomuraea sp. NPDC049625 TaxID=3155775 RepID=UPI00341B4153
MSAVVSAVAGAVRRLLPDHHDQLTLVEQRGEGDRFRIEGTTITGTSASALLTGVHWYLTRVAGVSAGWPGDSLSRLPDKLPQAPYIAKEAVVQHRFALNDTDDGYSGPYRDWATWERQIDLMALHGINEVLVTVGMEEVYRRTFTEFGYTDEQLRAWTPSPGHQPWWLLQNMAAFTGPVSEQLFGQRVRLAQQIVTRLRELDLTPVMPGYFGTVPPGFPGRVIPQGGWVGFERPDWLDPRDPMFAQVAEAFYRHQAELYGETSMVKMDLLHEGGTPGDVPVAEAVKAVQEALRKARPGATWVVLGWLDNPVRELIEAADGLLILDGVADRHPDLDRETGWLGTSYCFGTIPNFGGHTTIGANTGVWVSRFAEWRRGPSLRGIAYLPEGTGTNPASFALFAELAWHDEPIDHAGWFTDFSRRRYGGADPHAARAWEILRTTAYSLPADGWSEPQDSPFLARPSLTAANAATWSPRAPRYDLERFAAALEQLLQVDPALRGTSAYQFDLVDVARQALTNRSWVLLPALRAAFESGALERFRRLTVTWLEDMELLDRVVSASPYFLLGPWLAAARAAAADEEEAARLEYDARCLLTTWGPRGADVRLKDYANREWAGLVRDFHAMRWRLFFDTLLGGGDPEGIDWFAVEDAWSRDSSPYPEYPTADPYRVALDLYARLRQAIE